MRAYTRPPCLVVAWLVVVAGLVGVGCSSPVDEPIEDVVFDVGAVDTAVGDAAIVASNACGGVGVLAASPGEPCGACADGAWVCADPESLVCAGAGAVNACGGCGPLAAPADAAPGEACGACGGTWRCEGGALECAGEVATNACGGCAALTLEPGAACGDEAAPGVVRCRDRDTASCVPFGSNACGGEATLTAAPLSPCGTCGLGVWVCDGLDAVRCEDEDRGENACGGCRALAGAPGETCGRCAGAWVCDEDGDSVRCDAPPPNACGGCADLASAPGEPCEAGGTRYCGGPDQVVCGPPGGNACGGAAFLETKPGAPCGPCGDGVTLCAGPDSTYCADATATNVCGGCGFVPGVPGEACAPLGVWACADGALACAFAVEANACGGETPLAAVPGAACGTCDLGRVRCDGFEATRCVGGDEAAGWAWPDGDGDGHGDRAATPVVACTLGAQQSRRGDDCDDLRGDVFAGADEQCNGRDDDCDGATDEGALDAATFWPDADGDGAGRDAGAVRACARPEGFAPVAGDCDDNDARFHPEAVEDDCTDPSDYDCDGATPLFVDADGDGFGACEDCDDDAARHPGVVEICDTIDQDCDGATDEGAIDAPVWFVDRDADGVGDQSESIAACVPPGADWLAVGDDCDDDDPEVDVGESERCNGRDDDCDGETDELAIDRTTWFADADGDGFGDPLVTVLACMAQPGYVGNADDCDDGDAAVRPGIDIVERCDFRDNDCDGLEDEADAVAPDTWYLDVDRDGFGRPGSGVPGCVDFLAAARPTGRVANDDDCADADPDRYPGAPERPGDEIDQDCDGIEICFVDQDRDGYPGDFVAVALAPAATCPAELGLAPDHQGLVDCDDGDSDVSPDAIEVFGDEVDQDCDGLEVCFADRDDDGHRDANAAAITVSGDASCTGPREARAVDPPDDCNDGRGDVNPSVVGDGARDGLDNDCDGYPGTRTRLVAVDPVAGGDTGTCGDPTAPCATVGHALSRATACAGGGGTCEILLRAGVDYLVATTLEWVGGVDLLGMFSADFRSVPFSSEVTTRVIGTGASPLVRARGLSRDAWVQRVVLEGPSPAADPVPARGPDAVTVWVDGQSTATFTITDSVIVGGRGADGAGVPTVDAAACGASVCFAEAGEGGEAPFVHGPGDVAVARGLAVAGRTTGGQGGGASIAVWFDGGRLTMTWSDIVLGQGGAGADAVPNPCPDCDTGVCDDPCFQRAGGGAGGPVIGVAASRFDGLEYLGVEVPDVSLAAPGEGGAGACVAGTCGEDGEHGWLRDVMVVFDGEDYCGSGVARSFAPYVYVECVDELVASRDAAQAVCEGRGGDLVSWGVQGAGAAVDALEIVGAISPIYALWIGLQDQQPGEPYDWWWRTGHRLDAASARWAPGEPDPSLGEDCVEDDMVPLGTPGELGWNDGDCGTFERGWVCERATIQCNVDQDCPGNHTCQPDDDGVRGCFHVASQPDCGRFRASSGAIGQRTYECFAGAPRRWSEARQACQAIGADLVAYGSATEEDLVGGQIGLPLGVRVWIGLNDLASEGTYAWTTGEAVGYTHFASGEPNNTGGVGSLACAQMIPSVEKAWRVQRCDFQGYPLCAHFLSE